MPLVLDADDDERWRPVPAMESHDYIMKIVPTVYEDISGNRIVSYQYTYAYKVRVVVVVMVGDRPLAGWQAVIDWVAGADGRTTCSYWVACWKLHVFTHGNSHFFTQKVLTTRLKTTTMTRLGVNI